MARTIGDIADEIVVVQAEIDAFESQKKAKEKERDKLKEELAQAAAKEGLTRGGGKGSTFTVNNETVPHAADWDAIYKYIKRHGYWHLLHKRLGTTACQELWDRGIKIPGVDKFTQTKVTVKGV